MKKKKLSSRELQVIIGQQIAQASAATDIAKERGDLFDQYMGEPYPGDEKIKDRSTVVSTDIADTVEWIMPELMEIFTSGDKVVSFEPLGPDDEERAEQETDTVNHVFMRQNDGFLILYSMFKDALIQKVGYAKRWWDETESTSVEEYEGLTPDELLMLHQSWQQDHADIEFLEGENEPEGISVKVRLTYKKEQECVAPVPPEELLIARRWNSVFLDKCPFVAHKQTVTISQLIEWGYEREQVENLTSADDDEFGDERISRFDQLGAAEDGEESPAGDSMREVRIHECYLRTDYDGDGIAELRKITVGGAGNEILRWEDGDEDNEEVSSIPFSALTPVIIPHKHYGRSIAELVKDLQRIKTMLQRNLLDNIYFSNNPTKEIAEAGIGENTIEDMLTERPGKIIRTAEPAMYVEHTPPMLLGNILPAIEYFDTVRENRTGVSRLSQGLDANTINKTASGQAQLMTASQKKIALIARIFAETGVKDLFRGIHDDLRRNASRPMTIRLRGQWIPVDPRHWRQRADVAANVALGVGNAEQQMAKLMMIADKQEQNLLNGSPLVLPKNLLHTYEKMIDVSGFKNPGAFFNDPDVNPPPQQEPQPDPALMQVQGMLQIEQMKAQAHAQEAAAKLQIEQMKAQDQREKEVAQTHIDIAKMQFEAPLAHRESADKSRETDKKIELLDAQIMKIRSEIATAQSDQAFRVGESVVNSARADRQLEMASQKDLLSLSQRDRELEIAAKAKDAKAKALEPKPAPPEVKPRRRKITVTKHDAKGRILEATDEEY